MVVSPGLAEDLSLLVELARQVITQVSKASLKLILKGIEDVVDVAHGLLRLFLVLLNFTVRSMVDVRDICMRVIVGKPLTCRCW